MKSPHLCQRFLVIFVAAVTASSPGCFGPNKLGTSLYKWNMGISSDKWPKELVFAGLYLGGVYPICSFVDLFILNSIEFWSKDQPSTSSASANACERKTIVDGAHRIDLERQRVADAWRVHVQVFEGDRLIDDTVLLNRDDGTCVKLDSSGLKTAEYSARSDGSVVLRSPLGDVERIYSPSEVASILR